MVREVQRRPRIAVVDDERPYAWGSAFALGDDHDVVPMASARELLEAIEGGARFDLILSDVRMPQTNGLQLLRALRAVAPDQAERVFLVTGFLEHAPVSAELKGRVVEKPTSADELAAFVTEKLADLGWR